MELFINASCSYDEWNCLLRVQQPFGFYYYVKKYVKYTFFLAEFILS